MKMRSVAALCETILVTIFMPTIVVAVEYGPSILSLVRPNISSSVPFLYESNVLHLENYPHFTTVLPIAEGKPWIKSEEIIETLGKASLGSTVPFKVTPPKGHGIMAVIQELEIPAYNTFNRSLLVIAENGNIIKCFSILEFQIQGKSPVKVCGKTQESSGGSRPSVLDGVGPRSIIVPDGKTLSIRFIYRDHEIDNSTYLKKQVPFYDMGYIFRTSISFTAYRTCPHGPPFYDEFGAKLWPCDIPQSEREPVAACVREEVFCDGEVINCGIHTDEFGLDEKLCIQRTNNSSSTHPSSRGNSDLLDVLRMEEAIHSRNLHKKPFGYEDMIIQLHGHNSNKGNGGQIPEPMEKYPTVAHPAFIALVVMISIICVLLLGLLLRVCCKSCVGKLDPYALSSNPEAVARFHENLRSRDTEAVGRSPAAYGLSRDTLFKPLDDLPPSYDDLFPEDIIPHSSNKTSDNNSVPPNPPVPNGVPPGIAVAPRTSEFHNNDNGSSGSTSPIFTVPTSTCTILTNNNTAIFTNENSYVNPAFVHSVPS